MRADKILQDANKSFDSQKDESKPATPMQPQTVLKKSPSIPKKPLKSAGKSQKSKTKAEEEQVVE